MVPSASIPAVRQNRSKLTETASQALSTVPIPVGGKAVNAVIAFFMALLSFRGISTPSLPAQGEQRRSSYFNIPRGNSSTSCISSNVSSHFCKSHRVGEFKALEKISALGIQPNSGHELSGIVCGFDRSLKRVGITFD